MKRRTYLLLLLLACWSGLMGQYSFFSFFNFETVNPILTIDTTTNNIWQIGHPGKATFTGAFSAPNAIVTDTIYGYPLGNKSSFTITILNPNWWCGSPSVLSFWHKYDTDTMKDGGYIEVSYDGGNVWYNVIKDTVDPCNWGWVPFLGCTVYDVNDTLFNGEYGVSGSSNGWQFGAIEWLYMVGVKSTYPDSVMLRFTFISDTLAENKEGWMIDNITLHSDFPSAFLEMETVGAEARIFPNPVRDVLTVEFEEAFTGSLILTDLSGRQQLYEGITGLRKHTISTQKITSGIYIYTIKDLSSGTMESGKIAIHH